MVIGLSVDYTVHLGHMFINSRGENDLGAKMEFENIRTVDMVEYAVTKMGGTVIAGGITTGASAVFLFFATFAFFAKMATLILSTVLFSLLFAFGLFIPLCRMFGPGKRSALS